jgi:hypothetical protein
VGNGPDPPADPSRSASLYMRIVAFQCLCRNFNVNAADFRYHSCRAIPEIADQKQLKPSNAIVHSDEDDIRCALAFLSALVHLLTQQGNQVSHCGTFQRINLEVPQDL